MKNRQLHSARIVPVIGSLFASSALALACGEPVDAAAIAGGTNALAWCTSDASCEGEDAAPPQEPPAQTNWLVSCTSDAECDIGQCVCGLCSEPCNDEADACSGVPEGAACFGGRDIAYRAVCHATTVAGICLPPCNAGDDCGEGFICALGACLPDPS